MDKGDKAIWHPWSRQDDPPHPWEGHTVTIRETPNNPHYPLYHFSVDDAPNTNNPKSFWFWDTEDRLEPV